MDYNINLTFIGLNICIHSCKTIMKTLIFLKFLIKLRAPLDFEYFTVYLQNNGTVAKLSWNGCYGTRDGRGRIKKVTLECMCKCLLSNLASFIQTFRNIHSNLLC